MRYVGAVDEAGQAIDVQDPLAEQLKSLSDAGANIAAKMHALLSLREGFPESLAINPLFREPLLQAFSRLNEHGTQACTQELLK